MENQKTTTNNTGKASLRCSTRRQTQKKCREKGAAKIHSFSTSLLRSNFPPSFSFADKPINSFQQSAETQRKLHKQSLACGR